VKQSTEVPIMIAGNKSDLDSDRQVPQEKAKNFAKEKLGDQKLHTETSGIVRHFHAGP
jgi:GTPase SAR1 family protein